MKHSRLSQCCCFSVRTGSTIIALLGIIGNLIGLGYAAYYVDLIGGHPNQYLQLAKIIAIDVIMVAMLGVAINASLAYGAMAGRPRFMIPFIGLCLIGIILSPFGIVINSVNFFIVGAIVHGFALLFGGAVGAMLQYYFWLCVYSHYRDLNDARTRRSQSTA